MVRLGNYLRRYRKTRKLKLVAAAALTETSAGSISKIEQGNREPTIRTIVNIADGYKLDCFKLLEKAVWDIRNG